MTFCTHVSKRFLLLLICFQLAPLVCLSLPIWAKPQLSVPLSPKASPFAPEAKDQKSYFARRREFAPLKAELLESTQGYNLLVYRDLGGAAYGLPAVISLQDFAKHRFQSESTRILHQRVGEKIQIDSESEGLLNVDIPIRVPRGLSAITGEGETNLTITGRRRIELSGLSQYTLGQAQSAITRSSKFPTINFEQESQLTVEGTIGDRLTLSLEQNSGSAVDLSESLRLQYRGDEDGIIDVIEAGNTTLSLPGTRLIGFSAQGRGGLFGIKARGKVGAINFTLVTSQDKASSNRKTFEGQSEAVAYSIEDYRYLEDQYFFLDEVYRENFRNGIPPSPEDRVNVQSVRVFLNDFNVQNDIEDSAIPGAAYAFWRNGAPDIAASQAFDKGIQEGSFHELPPNDFTILPEGYLIMTNGRINQAFELAVAYQTGDGRNFGDIQFIPDPNNPENRIQLKLIKAKQQRIEDPTYKLSWRNVYSLGGRQIPQEGLAVGIFRESSGEEPIDNQNGVPYLQIFNLDTHTNGSSASSPPDNIIDIDGGNNIPGLLLQRGHLVFPFLEPFGESGLGAPDLDEDKRVPDIYTQTNPANRAEASRYAIRVRSASGSTEINLGFNIIENSEIIRLNNRTLERGKDYNIDYTFGRITFVGEAQSAVADPTADLDVSYQNTDLFGFGQSKSLLGVRLERPFSDQYSLIGMTLLYSNQSTPSQRIRVGQEPARTIIWDANARFRFKPQSLTDWVNSIPLVNTQAPSTIDLDVEVAQSLPNPNTKNVAYIDDFEGAENSQSFQIGKIIWSRSSTPTTRGSITSLPEGRLTWYNPIERDRASLTQIQPNRDDITIDQNVVDILTMRFDPARGILPPFHLTYDTNRPPQQSWAGLMRYLNGLDLSRAKFLELWIRGDNGRLHIDLGEVSERVRLPLDHSVHNDPNDRELYPNGFRTEDDPLGNLPTGDDVATAEEDIGLDRLTDAEEQEVFRNVYPGLSIPDDPSGDNFQDVNRNSTNIRDRYPPGLNGTSGNNTERNSRPDSEDLNSNGFLDTRESFIRYSVDLSTNRGYAPSTQGFDGVSVLVPGTESNAFIEQGGATNPPWRLLRIPLKGQEAPRRLEGAPDTTFSNAIDYVRFWMEHNDTTTVELYTFKAVGSDWQEDPLHAGYMSGDFQVATIGTDNSFYAPPPSLEREIDPTTGVRLSENSLALEFTDLYPGDRVSASRNFLQNADYTRYGTLTMFIHGGNPADPTYTTNFPAAGDSLVIGLSPVEASLRFTPINDDTTNFYEYRSRVYRGWEPEANTITVNLELMSQLKGQLLDLQSANQETDTLVVALQQGEFNAFYEKEKNQIQTEFEGSTYIVRGNPALSQIKAFTVGITNRGDNILLGKSEVWFDELRVDNIRKKSAFSAVMDVRTTLADLGNMTLNFERRSGDFQDLQGNASGNTTNRINFDSAINIDKFLPAEWNTTIPIRFSYNRFTSVPRIRPGSDVVLTPQQKKNENDVRSQTRFNISWRKRPAQEKPRLASRLFFDKVSTSLNYSSDASTSGAITQRRSAQNQNLNGSFSYSQNWSQRKALQIFKWVPLLRPLREAQFSYMPSSLNYQSRFNRGKNNSLSFRAVGGDTANVINTNTENFTLNESYSVKYSPFRSLSTDYQLGVDRDLRNGFSFTQMQFGRETSRTQSVNFRYSPNISRWLRIDPSYSANYREQLETGGQRVQLGSVRKGLTVNMQNTSQARLNFNLPSLFQTLTRRSASDTTFSILRIVGKMGGSIQAVQASVTRTKTFGAFGLTKRPSLAYQFGLEDSAKVPAINTGAGTRVNTRTIRDQAQASTGVRLPLGFQISTTANYSQSQDLGNTRTKSDQLTYPKLDAVWRGLEKIPILSFFWSSSSASMGYQESHTRQGDGGLDNQNLTSDTRETSFNPLFQWTARWKGDINTSLRSNKSEQNTLRYQRNVTADTATVRPTLADRLIGTTLTKQNGMQADLSYSLRGRFQRSLELNLSFQLGSNTQSELQRSATGTPADPIVRQDGSNWSLSLGTQYAFSTRFTGGANFRHERRKDRIRDLTNVAWDFRFWGEIGFQ